MRYGRCGEISKDKKSLHARHCGRNNYIRTFQKGATQVDIFSKVLNKNLLFYKVRPQPQGFTVQIKLQGLNDEF